MNGKISDIIYWGLIICFTFVACVNGANSQQKYDGERKIGTVERMLLRHLGLPADVNDNEIIQLLDDDKKFHSAVALIRYRKISSAVPKLLEIFNAENPSIIINVNRKKSVANALCDFGNTDWVPEIRNLLNDPNKMTTPNYRPKANREPLLSKRIGLAGLLARAGDYSFFELVASHINDNEKYIRLFVIAELGNFGHETDPVTNKAADTLLAAATSDPDDFLREQAIYSLEKLAKKRPDVEKKLIQAFASNVDSNYRSLKIMSLDKLKALNDPNRLKISSNSTDPNNADN